MVKRLDRFIFKAFLGPFVAILLIVIFILLMQFLWLYIDELVGKGLGLRVILEFMAWGACTILPMALPLSTLLSSMMVIGQMAENNELLAIRAAGISFGRVLVPLSVIAIAISIGAFYAGNELVPKAYNEIYTLRDDIGKTKDEIKIPSGIFYDGIEGYVLRVDDKDKETGALLGVMVYDHTGNKGNSSVTLADSAYLSMSKSKDYLSFVLFNGCNYKEENSNSRLDSTRRLQRIDFKRQELIIPLSNYAFQKSDTVRYGEQSKSMNLKQLRHEHDSLNTRISNTKNTQIARLNVTSPFIYYSQLDTSKHMMDVRHVFSQERHGKWKNISAAQIAYQDALSAAESYKSSLSSFSREHYEPMFWLRRVDIDMLKKYAQALACLLLFFIGAPLGALIRKGGLGLSAIVSALFFVLYWVIDISGSKLARDGALGAPVGVFISAYVLAPIGVFLTWKAINDAELLGNMDLIKIWWRKLKSKIVRLFRPTRIVFMGTPDFAVASLDKLIKNGYKVVGVVTVADKASGRGLQVNESAVKKYASQHNLPVLQPTKLKDPDFIKALKALKADLFVVVAFRMLPQEVWSMPRLGCFNLHAALLPQYRGAAPINWAVINGERMTGVTTFMIDKDIDTGGIILRQECRIGSNDCAGDVHDKLMNIGSELVVQTVEGLIQHNLETRVQRSFIQGSEVLKSAPKLSRELCHIDWNDTSDRIYNLIRGLSPYPTAYTDLVSSEGKFLQLKIFQAEKMPELKGEPGQILTDSKKYLAIATKDGAIGIKELQISGKKRMEVKAFLLGFRDADKYSTSKGSSRDFLDSIA